jgi:transcription elongation factor Elf1
VKAMGVQQVFTCDRCNTPSESTSDGSYPEGFGRVVISYYGFRNRKESFMSSLEKSDKQMILCVKCGREFAEGIPEFLADTPGEEDERG